MTNILAALFNTGLGLGACFAFRSISESIGTGPAVAIVGAVAFGLNWGLLMASDSLNEGRRRYS